MVAAVKQRRTTDYLNVLSLGGSGVALGLSSSVVEREPVHEDGSQTD